MQRVLRYPMDVCYINLHVRHIVPCQYLYGHLFSALIPAVCAFVGKYVEITDTIKGFKGIMEGKHDDLPEMAFYMVGDIKEVQEKADKMAKDMAESNK